jgi:hypothetical protein
MSSSHYIKEAIANLERHVKSEGLRSMRSNYWPELETSLTLSAEQVKMGCETQSIRYSYRYNLVVIFYGTTSYWAYGTSFTYIFLYEMSFTI